MGRPPSITEEEILAAARAVFLEKGIAATTADVAARCGVGEATIFRRFPTKQELARAALTTAVPDWILHVPERAGEGDLHKTLIEIGAQMLATGRKVFPLFVMSMQHPSMAEFERRNPARRAVLSAFATFFTSEIAAGRLRVRDERVATHVFLGTIMNYLLFDLLFKGKDMVDERTLLAGLADTLCAAPAGPAT